MMKIEALIKKIRKDCSDKQYQDAWIADQLISRFGHHADTGEGGELIPALVEIIQSVERGEVFKKAGGKD